jgi:hypothetical protein
MNLESEFKFFNLLGYELVEVKDTKKNLVQKWRVLDKIGNCIGSIEKRVNANDEKQVPKYRIYVNNNVIIYECEKTEDTHPENCFSFELIDDNRYIYQVELVIGGNNPRITIWNSRYGHMSFILNKNSLYAEFESETKNLKIRETVSFQRLGILETDSDYKKEYAYKMAYCDKKHKLDYCGSEGKNAVEVHALYEPSINGLDRLKITQSFFKDEKLLLPKDVCICDGTIMDSILINHMGIDAVNYLRDRLDAMLPFEKDIVSILLEGVPLAEIKPEITLFFPDVIKREEKSKKKNHVK